MCTRLHDLHVHTDFSPDSSMTMLQAAQAAAAAGLQGIGFADHLDLDYPYSEWVTGFDLARYRESFEEVRGQAGIAVYLGVEMGLQPCTHGQCSAVVAGGMFDYVIASMHVFRGEDPFYSGFYEKYTREAGIQLMLSATLECLQGYEEYDILGHLDYALTFREGASALDYAEAPDLVDQLLAHLVRQGKSLEVNASGLRRAGSTLPSFSVLKRYRELGGERVSLGSDAHMPGHIGWKFPETLAMLKSLGFRHTVVFRDRKPSFIPID
jgi:histidinol-phosphatase (PHP family)